MRAKNFIGAVAQSTHKWDYIWVGICHLRTPHRVYEICHSEEIYDNNHYAIVKQLVKRNVVQNRFKDYHEEECLRMRMQTRL